MSVRWWRRTCFILVGRFGAKGGARCAVAAAHWKVLWAAGFQLAIGFKVQVEACMSHCGALWEIRFTYSGWSPIINSIPGAAGASVWYVATGTWNNKPTAIFLKTVLKFTSDMFSMLDLIHFQTKKPRPNPEHTLRHPRACEEFSYVNVRNGTWWAVQLLSHNFPIALCFIFHQKLFLYVYTFVLLPFGHMLISFILLQKPLYPAQGCRGSRVYPGNTVRMAELHPGWDACPSYAI